VSAALTPHQRYRALIDAIEGDCRVADWRAGDVDLWPIASQDLFLDMFRQAGGNTAPKPPPFAVRAANGLATPVVNLWKSRHDLAHWVSGPSRADAVLLGDGISLDRVDGRWRDRFGEPVAAALEAQGRTCFVMQSGNLTRLPWARPTYAANRVAARAALGAALTRGTPPNLPDHPAVLRLLAQAGVEAPSLALPRVAKRARVVAAQAAAFDRILRRVRPATAFVVTYYAGLGHAFALACRRRGILCVDLQHCPHDGTHRAYHWPALPERGYSTVPSLFWTWTEAEAAGIRRWAGTRDRGWHGAIAGGHSQIAALREANGKRLWQEAAAAIGDVKEYERNILVALQPIGGKRDIWEGLGRAIESAPPTWRWWIRRHPASTPVQDSGYARLLSLRGPNVIVGSAPQTPLPALLGHMDAVVSLASGAAGEAAMFGIPAFFLDDEAHDTFPQLIAQGQAAVVRAGSLIAAIAKLPAHRGHHPIAGPAIEDTLAQIDRISREYRQLCREAHPPSER
jgi:hypothetical protein